MYANIINLDINNNISEFIKSHPLYPYIKLYGYNDLNLVNTKIPTLYIGYRLNKERIPEINIGNTFISETERWAFTPQESAIFFIEQCTNFLNEIPTMLVQALIPLSLEPIFSPIKTPEQVNKFINDFNPTVAYIHNDILTLNNNSDEVMVINIPLWEAFGIKNNDFMNILHNNNSPLRIIDDTLSKVRVFFMDVFNYKPELITLYAPYLINLKPKTSNKVYS